MRVLVTLALVMAITLSPEISHGQDASSTENTKSKETNEKNLEKAKDKKNKPPAVDIAILLDTSNSMDGLISQARSQLWNIVQQVGSAEKKNQKPKLRVAVFEYGNSKLPASENYLRQVVQLTDDLDKVSEGLFALKTDGGDEYCGAVIQEAIQRLDWTSKRNSYKAIYIAGNEPFTQGEVDFEKSCRTAIESGIVVNTVHCGNYQRGVEGQWKRGAELAEGKFMNINQDKKLAQIKTPHDAILIELNVELNRTYLWYGTSAQRGAFQANQLQQDKNSATAGASSSRIATKAGALYSNRGRDLVDSQKGNANLLDKIDEQQLPESMRKMTLAERKAYVSEMAKKRAEIQRKIGEENTKREAFLMAKKKEAGSAKDTFGDAISEAVAAQLEQFGFEIK